MISVSQNLDGKLNFNNDASEMESGLGAPGPIGSTEPRGVKGDQPGIKHRNLIADYFKKLDHEVTDVQRVLWHRDGSVFIATFKETTPRDKAFAVIVNGEVSGYDIEFWKDQDQYKMVLQQHLGMLQMDAPDKPKEKVEREPVIQETVKARTLDAVVETYEAMVKELKEKHQAELEKFLATASKFEYSNRLAQSKLAQIEAVLNGTVNPPPKPKTAADVELEAVGEVLGQDGEPVFGETEFPAQAIVEDGKSYRERVLAQDPHSRCMANDGEINKYNDYPKMTDIARVLDGLGQNGCIQGSSDEE